MTKLTSELKYELTLTRWFTVPRERVRDLYSTKSENLRSTSQKTVYVDMPLLLLLLWLYFILPFTVNRYMVTLAILPRELRAWHVREPLMVTTSGCTLRCLTFSLAARTMCFRGGTIEEKEEDESNSAEGAVLLRRLRASSARVVSFVSPPIVPLNEQNMQ